MNALPKANEYIQHTPYLAVQDAMITCLQVQTDIFSTFHVVQILVGSWQYIHYVHGYVCLPSSQSLRVSIQRPMCARTFLCMNVLQKINEYMQHISCLVVQDVHV